MVDKIQYLNLFFGNYGSPHKKPLSLEKGLFEFNMLFKNNSLAFLSLKPEGPLGKWYYTKSIFNCTLQENYLTEKAQKSAQHKIK